MHLIGFAESNYLPSAFDNEVLSDGFCQRPRGSESHGCRHSAPRPAGTGAPRHPQPRSRCQDPHSPRGGGDRAARGCWAQHQPCGTAGPAATREGAAANLVPVAKRGPGAAPPLLLPPCSRSVPTSLLRVPQPSPEPWRCGPCGSLRASATDPSSCSIATGHSGSLLPPQGTQGRALRHRGRRFVLHGQQRLLRTPPQALLSLLPSHKADGGRQQGAVGGCRTHSAPSPGSPLPDPGMGLRGCPEPPTRCLSPPHPGAAAWGRPAGSNPGQLGRCHHAAAACVPVTPSSSPRTLRRCRRPP